MFWGSFFFSSPREARNWDFFFKKSKVSQLLLLLFLKRLGVLLLFYFLAMLHSIWGISYLTRDQTHAPAEEARSPNCQTTREVLPSV